MQTLHINDKGIVGAGQRARLNEMSALEPKTLLSIS
jgi:hypothetical protein